LTHVKDAGVNVEVAPAEAECFPPAQTRDQQHPVQRVQRILRDRAQERCRIALIPRRSPGSLRSHQFDGCRWVAPQQPTLDRGVQRGLAGGVDPAQRFRPDGTLPLGVTAGDGEVRRLEMLGSYRAQPVVTQVWDQVLVDVASVGQSGRGAQ